MASPGRSAWLEIAVVADSQQSRSLHQPCPIAAAVVAAAAGGGAAGAFDSAIADDPGTGVCIIEHAGSEQCLFHAAG